MTPIAADIFARLGSFVESRIGLAIRAGDGESFRKTLLARMKGANIIEPEEYLHLLEADTIASHQEWQALIILLTTGESYFFRDQGHFFLLRNTILPELLKNRQSRRSLRIWSAGCATGEEPYSIAILLDLLLPDRQGWDIFILGTDINEESLNKAERGLYSPWSFRLMDKNIQEKYFTSCKGDWRIAEKIRNMVSFQGGNLLDSGFFSKHQEIGGMDIIICRNVFIYFNNTAIASVLNNLSNLLNEAGYLITGHGELQGHELVNLRAVLYPEAVIYKKVMPCKGQPPEIPAIPHRQKAMSLPVARVKPRRQPSLPVQSAGNISPQSPQSPRTEIEALIGQGRFGEAHERAKKNLPAGMDRHDMLCLVANGYANSGDYQKAADACREAISSKADSAAPYFLLAYIAEAEGSDEEAKVLFKKVIYLDSAFVAAYCELGGLYAKEGDLMHAEKSLGAAIELLRSLPASTTVTPYDITAGELLKQLEKHSGPGHGSIRTAEKRS